MFSTDKKVRYAFLSILSNTTLIIIKVIAGILSGSVSIISEAIHSGMDLAASMIAFFSVRQSTKPADREHPYGHGKIENISGMAEGLLIFVAAAMIIIEALKKIYKPVEIEQATVAIIVMLISALVNFFIARKLYQVSREEDSMALRADALHLKTDVYTSLGVGLGILLIKLTGIHILDPIIAMLVALLIIMEAYKLCKNAYDYLLDTKLTDAEVIKIEKIICQYNDKIKDFHKIKTRKSGNMKHIDFHITVDPQLTVAESHKIIGCLKKDMAEEFKYTRVSVHVDPQREEEQQNIP
ncbi:MAG TPA: cation diffusion facilitator family transporter [Desulfitobacteriaceae bacterium]|nr:cation diffusion facilitator family transporter [Desulfitobacteriaceae bacterium]